MEQNTKPLIMCLGPAGTNAHEAASLYFTGKREPGALEPNFWNSNFDALREVALAKTPRPIFGVAPIENSSAGLVEDTRQFWLQMLLGSSWPCVSGVRVVGEVHLPITHCLARRPESLGTALTAVYSHPQALSQCRAALAGRNITGVSQKSTAAAAQMLANGRLPIDDAVICSRFAAELYGLTIVEEGLEDQKGNQTRFHVVAQTAEVPEPTGADRMALMLEIENRPGALAGALNTFAAHAVNLSSQHAIPLGVGRYAHYLEAECHENDPQGSKVLTCLGTLVTEGRLLVLGSYPRAEHPAAAT